jgi:hypothetical protein
MRLRYAVGLTHGIRWWMLWEETRARSQKTRQAWSQAADGITAADIEKALTKFCTANPCAHFLDGLVETMWKVAKANGAPVPHW